MKRLRLSPPVLFLSLCAAADASAEAPADLAMTVTTAHVLPSVRTAEALARKLSPSMSQLKLEAMANVFLGLDRAMGEALEGPVDLALLKGAEGDFVGAGAFSVAWKDPSKLRGIGAANGEGVRPVPLDATPILQQLAAQPTVGSEGACALHPSPAAPGYRLVCASNAATLAKLGGYLAREVALEAHDLDVAARFPVSKMMVDVDASPMTGEPNALENAAADDMKALARDTASAAIGVGWDANELSFAVDARFKSQTSTTTKLLLSADGHGRSVPSLFERLPTDTLVFGTTGGFDPTVSRDLAQRGLTLATDGSDPAGVVVLRPIVDAFASHGLASSLAVGLDTKRALAAVEALRKKPTDEALRRRASRALTPWVVLEADGLQDNFAVLESAMALSDTAKVLAPAKGSKWPAQAKAWTLDDGAVFVAMPTATSLMVVFASDASVVQEKLKLVTATTGARMALTQETRDAFRDKPAAAVVVTDRVGDLAGLSIDEDALADTVKALREDAKKKGPAAQIPMIVTVKKGSAATDWQGSIRGDARYPVKALQAITKGAKGFSKGLFRSL